MIVLDTTTRKLQIALATTKTSLDAIWNVSWEDTPISVLPGSGPPVGGSANGVTNGATAVDMVPAPPPGVIRRILSIQLNNADTGSITPNITLNDNATGRVIFKVTRATLEQLTYEDRAGFQCFSVAGVRQ